MIRIVLVAAVLFVTGCTVGVRTPVSRFDTPEAMGHPGRIDLNGGRAGANNAVLTRSIGSAPPDTTNVIHERSSYLFLGADVAVADGIDIGIRNYSEGRIKFQMFGPGRTRARAGDWAGAVTFAGGAYADQNSAVSLLPSQSVDAKKIEIFGEGGVTFGHRFFDWMLFWMSASGRYTYFDGTYTITPTGPTGPASQTSTPFSGNVVSYNANAGVELGIPAISLRLEYGYGQHQSGLMNRGSDYWGAQVVIAFDLAHADAPVAAPPPAAAPKRTKPLRRPNVDEDAVDDSAPLEEAQPQRSVPL